MKEYCERALNVAQLKGATYADVRIVGREVQGISVKNGQVQSLTHHESFGFGVRVLCNGAWGFAASATLSQPEIERTAALAVQLARAAARTHLHPVDIGRPEKNVGSYRTPVKTDPFHVPLSDKITLLLHASETMQKVQGVAVAEAAIELQKEEKTFASTEGSFIEQEIIETGCGIEATAVGENDVQNRSYPNSVGRHQGTEGWEFLERWDLVGNSGRIAEEAVALLTAKPCPPGVTTVILDGSQVALQVHESCGHAVELDRVLGTEAAFAGTSFLTTDKLSGFRYGSGAVSLTADATIPGGLGTFGFDDEGIPAQRWPLVERGQFVGYLMSRETAAGLGLRSNGAMRADGWGRLPLIRMTNVNLEPGEWTLEDLISDTEDGILMQTNRSWSIDDKRLNFQFGTEIGWEIKHGKRGDMLKNPTYTGMTPAFWGSCDAVCNRDHWVIWGTPNCGKGQPEQVAHTGHGAAPARFRNVRVGV
ncbi:MAG: TldD/PmbA family protein, partial [Chloroflexota bacterium]